MQAAFLVPMAVSLAFGVLFATFITLILVPTSYLIVDDMQQAMRRMFGREEPVAPAGRAAHDGRNGGGGRLGGPSGRGAVLVSRLGKGSSDGDPEEIE